MGTQTIYTPGRGLGDNWYSINKLLRMDDPNVLLSRYSRPENARRVDVLTRLQEILPLLDAPVERIKITNKRPTNYRTGFHSTPWSVDYFPTHERWQRNQSNKICYHFDANFVGKIGGVPDSEWIEDFLRVMREKGYDLVRLGKHLSLSEMVKELASCKAFIGTSSGPMHVARSVRVPTCLVLANNVDTTVYHVGQLYTPARTVKEILFFLSSL